MIKQIAALAAAGLVAITGAFAGDAPEAEAFVVSLVSELKTKAETDGEGSLSVRETLEANLATESIGKFLLAGKAAKQASDDQRARYDQLFPSYIAAAYAEEIGQLTARDIRVKNSVERKPGDILVESDLFDSKGAQRASIVWRVRINDAGEHKLLDVLVERISPLITRRQSFSKMVKDDGLDGLLAHMEETIAAGIVIDDQDA